MLKLVYIIFDQLFNLKNSQETMSKTKMCNGIMFMKERKLEELENQNRKLNEEFNNETKIFNQLKQKQSYLKKEIVPLENEFNIIEIDILMKNKQKNELLVQIEKIKQQENELNQQCSLEQNKLIKMQKKLYELRQNFQEKQSLLKRLIKENQFNKKIGEGRGKIFQEREKYKVLIQKDQRQLEIMKNSMESKIKFISILTKKQNDLISQVNKQKSKKSLQNNQVTKKQQLVEVIKNIDSLKLQKMKSFERIVRHKNAVLIQKQTKI